MKATSVYFYAIKSAVYFQRPETGQCDARFRRTY